MKFLRRTKDGSSPEGGRSEHVPVADGELEPIIGELAGMVIESLTEVSLPPPTLELLQVGLPYITQRECSTEAVIAGQTAARLGYLSRSAEFATFEDARAADDDLLATLNHMLEAADAEGSPIDDVMAELAAEMATAESINPPSFESGPSWSIPGLNGDARGSLRRRMLSGMQCPSDLPSDDLQRTWKYGYFLRVLDELVYEEEEEG